MHDNPDSQVSLECSSLYVVTRVLPHSTPFAVDWDLIHVDSSGRTTRHRWRKTINPQSALNGIYTNITLKEWSPDLLANNPVFPRTKVDRFVTISPDRMTLGYFKVDGFKNPLYYKYQKDFVYGAFHRANVACHGPPEADWRTGYTGRDWVLRVLDVMCKTGVVRKKEVMASLERVIEDTTKQQQAKWMEEVENKSLKVFSMLAIVSVSPWWYNIWIIYIWLNGWNFLHATKAERGTDLHTRAETLGSVEGMILLCIPAHLPGYLVCSTCF